MSKGHLDFFEDRVELQRCCIAVKKAINLSRLERKKHEGEFYPADVNDYLWEARRILSKITGEEWSWPKQYLHVFGLAPNIYKDDDREEFFSWLLMSAEYIQIHSINCCNRNVSEWENRLCDWAKSTIRYCLWRLNPELKDSVRFDGDCRGSVTYIDFPDGSRNGWGDGWYVPTISSYGYDQPMER